MKKITSLPALATALGKHANCSAWEKNGKQRLYFNGIGYNTKKMTTKVWIELREGAAYTVVIIDCPSQPSSWIESQQQEIKGRMAKYIRYISRFFDFGVTSQPVEVIMNNAFLDAEPVQGYYTEWREVRVPINRYGKLAMRNRQFVVPFSGTKNDAPSRFVPLTLAAYQILLSRGETMLEPYQSPLDYDYIASRLAENNGRV